MGLFIVTLKMDDTAPLTPSMAAALVIWNILIKGKPLNIFSGILIVNKANGYETWQTSLLYVFVSIFCLDRAQTTIDFEVC